MKKLLISAVVVGLVAGSLAAPAVAKKKKKPKRVERVAEAAYSGSANIVYLPGASFGGGAFAIGGDEQYLSFKITDASGTTVSANVGQDPDGDNQVATVGEFCGKTEEPIKVEPGLDVTVFVEQGTCGGGPSIVTEGTIKATISNLP